MHQQPSIVGILSQELIDQIIDYLGDTYLEQSKAHRYEWQRAPMQEGWRNSLADLRSAALISQGFRSRSQFHIFSVLRLFLCDPGLHSKEETSARHRERMQGLLNLLQTRLNLAGAQIYMSIHFNISNLEEYDSKNDIDMTKLVDYLRGSSVRITGLEISSIKSSHFSGKTVLEKLVNNMLDISYLSRLELRRFGMVPLSLFFACPRLRDVVIEDICAERWTGTSVHQYNPVRLQSLAFGGLPEYLGVLIGADNAHHDDRATLDVTQLKSLTVNARGGVTVMEEEIQYHAILSRLCGQTLSNLWVNLGQVLGGMIPTLSLSSFHNLRNLGIRVDWGLTTNEHLCSWISQLPPTPTLHEVNLRIIFQANVAKLLGENWEIVGRTLCGLFSASECSKKTVSIYLATFRLIEMGGLQMIPPEYLDPATWDDNAARRDPTIREAVIARASHYLFNISLLPRLSIPFVSSDIDLKISLGGEVQFLGSW